MEADNEDQESLQEFLDENQYNKKSILRYERIFGRNFLSTGGLETTENFTKLLELQPGSSVLDIGSGIGGSAFYMAQNYKVDVLGLDISTNMVKIAVERLSLLKNTLSTKVEFRVADATKEKFEQNHYDVIYSRDSILHIKNKKCLFTSILGWLKPGGRLLISDYCCGSEQHSPEFKDYVAQRGYHLLSPVEYGELLETVGFTDVTVADKTEYFIDILEKELERITSAQDEFLQDFNATDLDALVTGWQNKLVRCRRGEQKWGLILAKKNTLSS